jgi:hypothetical protein
MSRNNRYHLIIRVLLRCSWLLGSLIRVLWSLRRKCDNFSSNFLIRIFPECLEIMVPFRFLICAMRFYITNRILGYWFVPSIAYYISPRCETDATAGIGLEYKDTVSGIFNYHSYMVCIILKIPKLDLVKNLWALAKKWLSWKSKTSPVSQFFVKKFYVSILSS